MLLHFTRILTVTKNTKNTDYSAVTSISLIL